jgi:alpha-D-ribose 1-methylphosphonate 5-triphosphate synthase subunit PhnL
MPALQIDRISKSYILHTQGGRVLPVLDRFDLEVEAGECVALSSPSGSGKSTILRAIYGNARVDSGAIWVHHEGERINLTAAAPRLLLALRREVLGYISQFLRVIPRVPALDIIAAPLYADGVAQEEAQGRAARLLARLNLPERLWSLPPATFSGGEQQRVNIALAFIKHYPVLLLDEPTASLDAANRDVVVQLIEEAKQKGAAIIGAFHDRDTAARIASRQVSIEAMA